jgi:hypothetical protein
LILIGGADQTEPDRQAALEAFLATVARHCERTGTVVVDGGTDSGVMRPHGCGAAPPSDRSGSSAWRRPAPSSARRRRAPTSAPRAITR